jgi:hypothetical protein
MNEKLKRVHCDLYDEDAKLASDSQFTVSCDTGMKALLGK